MHLLQYFHTIFFFRNSDRLFCDTEQYRNLYYILRRNLDAETTKVKLNVVVQAGKERRQGTAGVLKPGAATRGCFMILGVRRKGFRLTVID